MVRFFPVNMPHSLRIITIEFAARICALLVGWFNGTGYQVGLLFGPTWHFWAAWRDLDLGSASMWDNAALLAIYSFLLPSGEGMIPGVCPFFRDKAPPCAVNSPDKGASVKK